MRPLTTPSMRSSSGWGAFWTVSRRWFARVRELEERKARLAVGAPLEPFMETRQSPDLLSWSALKPSREFTWAHQDVSTRIRA